MIALTGGTGYLGRNFLKTIQNKHNNIVVFVRENSDLSFLDKYNRENITVYNYKHDIQKVLKGKVALFHFATDYGYNSSDLETIEANLILPLKIISYLDKGSLFLNTDTVLPKRINSYTLSKKHFLEWLDTYADDFKIINLEIEHFYGPGDDKSKFVLNIIEKLLLNEKEILLTKGEQYRDFVYIDDVIDAIISILDNLNNFSFNEIEKFQLATGAPCSIHDFVKLTADISGNKTTRLKFGAIPYRKNEVMKIEIDISRLQELGWKAKHTLRDGILATIEDMINEN